MTPRALSKGDVVALRRLWLDGLERFPSAFLLTPAEARATSDAALATGCEAGQYWGAFIGTELAGFAKIRPGGSERLRHTCDLGPLYVAPEYQGKGIARALMSAVIQHAQSLGLKQMELCVDQQNTAAIRLYRACGFVPFGMRPRSVMLDGEARHDLLMIRMLDAAIHPERIAQMARAAVD